MPDRRRHRIRDLGLVQFGTGMKPEKLVSYDEYNAGTGPQPVVCARCADGPPAVPSVRDSCVRCGAVVWVSPATEASLPLMRQPELWCLHCCAAHVEEDEERHAC